MAVPSDVIRCGRRRAPSGLAVDHVAAIDHHGRHLGVPAPPRHRRRLVSAADARCSAWLPSRRRCYCAARLRIGRAGRRQFDLDALGQIQLDHARAGCWICRDGGCRSRPARRLRMRPGRAGTAAATPAGDARYPQPRDGFQEGSRHGGRPGNESKALVERRRQSNRCDKECAPRAPALGNRRRKREPRLPRGPGGSGATTGWIRRRSTACPCRR